jgi:carbon starvation protein
VPIVAVFAAVLILFFLAYRFYGGFLARRFGLDAARTTPAHELADGEDYVPVKRGYLLAQHFSAISAAGPIVGPIAAGLAFGWVPALLWIVFGCIFIGALHDFAALVGSVRHRARTVAEIVREHMSRPAYFLFLGFVWLALVYVIVAFTDVTARSFTDRLELENGTVVKGAGVATASILYLALGVAMGFALKFGRWPLRVATAVFVPLVGVAIWFGQQAPLTPPFVVGEGKEGIVRAWAYLILAYCGVASITPMWALLQPRGFLGGFFLYGVLVFSCGGLLLGGGATAIYPAFRGFESAHLGSLFPFLFITIACGACSGFHGLVCSGTTSRQLDREPDAHVVGYGGMLLEGVVAVISLICVMSVAEGSIAAARGPDALYALGVGAFVARFGIDPGFATAFASLAFATFVYDTLDVATRLGRYVLQELIGAKSRIAGVLATLATLALPALFVSATTVDAAGKVVPGWRVFWGIFGASNQLLAALTLLGLTLWLRRSGRARLAVLTAIPMTFMMGMTLWALVLTLIKAAKGMQSGKPFGTPNVIAAALLVIAVLLIAEAVRAFRRPARAEVGPAPEGS